MILPTLSVCGLLEPLFLQLFAARLDGPRQTLHRGAVGKLLPIAQLVAQHGQIMVVTQRIAQAMSSVDQFASSASSVRPLPAIAMRGASSSRPSCL